MKNIGFYFLTRARKSRSKLGIKKIHRNPQTFWFTVRSKIAVGLPRFGHFWAFWAEIFGRKSIFQTFFECLIKRQIPTTRRAERRRRKNFCDFDLDLGILTHWRPWIVYPEPIVNHVKLKYAFSENTSHLVKKTLKIAKNSHFPWKTPFKKQLFTGFRFSAVSREANNRISQ